MDQSNELEQLSALWAETSEAKRLGSSKLDVEMLDIVINSLTLNNTLRLLSLTEIAKGNPARNKVK